MSLLRYVYAIPMLIALLSLANGVFASDREQALKAGFIYNFARYSEGDWFNQDLNTAYVLCGVEQQFVDTAKAILKGQQVKSRPVEVKLITAPTKGCHSLFLAQPFEAEFLASQIFQHTMLIGQSDDFTAQGGHINFFIAGGKIRFEVNPTKLKSAGIKLSSKVLRMGRVINQGSAQ